jgi:hypothetical protein
MGCRLGNGTRDGVSLHGSDARPRAPGAPVAFIGEARHWDRRPGMAGLRRRQHLRGLVTAAGHDAQDAVSGLVSASGFTAELTAAAIASLSRILLANLGAFCGQTP